MKSSHERAFKEWAISCEALRSGEQILLIRKGGIREEGGRFTIADSEFFLMPTHEHQNPDLLQSRWVPRLKALQEEVRHGVSVHSDKGETVTLSTYAVVDTIVQARDEDQVNRLSDFHIWNPGFVKQRFDYNPYDPLYLILLRVYNLVEPVILPMRKDYIGCKSWVTLESPLALNGATPALTEEAYGARRSQVLELLM